MKAPRPLAPSGTQIAPMRCATEAWASGLSGPVVDVKGIPLEEMLLLAGAITSELPPVRQP